MLGLYVHYSSSVMGHVCNVVAIFVQGHMPIISVYTCVSGDIVNLH